MNIDLILEQEPTPDFKAMIGTVLQTSIDDSKVWKCGFMAPTKFATRDVQLRVYVVASLRSFRIPFLTKKREDARSPNVIETTDIEAFHRFLHDGRVRTISEITEDDLGTHSFSFATESDTTFEVKHSNINLPYLEASHLGFC